MQKYIGTRFHIYYRFEVAERSHKKSVYYIRMQYDVISAGCSPNARKKSPNCPILTSKLRLRSRMYKIIIWLTTGSLPLEVSQWRVGKGFAYNFFNDCLAFGNTTRRYRLNALGTIKFTCCLYYSFLSIQEKYFRLLKITTVPQIQ